MSFICLFVSEWLYQVSRGVDHEPVRPRQLPKSTGCGKNFPGKTKLATGEQVSLNNNLSSLFLMRVSLDCLSTDKPVALVFHTNVLLLVFEKEDKPERL